MSADEEWGKIIEFVGNPPNWEPGVPRHFQNISAHCKELREQLKRSSCTCIDKLLNMWLGGKAVYRKVTCQNCQVLNKTPKDYE